MQISTHDKKILLSMVTVAAKFYKALTQMPTTYFQISAADVNFQQEPPIHLASLKKENFIFSWKDSKHLKDKYLWMFQSHS